MAQRKPLAVNERGVSRRKLLALSSGAAIGGLAGCAGSNEDPDDDDDGGEPSDDLEADDLVDSTIDVMDGNTPEEVNMNRFAQNTGYHWIVREWYAIQTNSMEEPDWVLLDGDETGYDMDSDTWTYKVKEDEFYWANGDAFTAEDIYVQYMVDQLQRPEEQRYWEEINLVDDWTLELVAPGPSNPILTGYPTDRHVSYREWERPWLERLEDVSTEDERDEITAEIVNTRIDIQEFIDEGLSSSVWMPVDWDESKVVFEKNEKHPYADELVYDELIAHTCDGAACDELIRNERIDIGPNRFPRELRGVSPDHLQTIHESQAPGARNLYFRYDNEHTGNRWVRRALLAVLDLEFLVDFWQGEGGFVKQHQTGMAEGLENRFLEPDFIDSLYQYPIEGDVDLATEFMENGGYELDDDTWVDENGDPIEFYFTIPGGSAFQTLGQAIYDVWSDFGVEPDFRARDIGELTGHLFDGTGDVDVTLWLSGWGQPHPLDAFDWTNPFFNHLATPGDDDIEGWLEEGETNSRNNGRPIVIEIPEEPGELTTDGPTKEINLYELVEEFRTEQDEERSLEIVRDLVQYFNYDLPRPDLFPQIDALWGNTERFYFPDDHDYYHDTPDNTQHLVHRFGVMKGRSEE